MFRIPHISKITCVAIKSLSSRPTVVQSNNLLKSRAVIFQRLYSSKGDDKAKKGSGFTEDCPPKDAQKCTTQDTGGPCPTKKVKKPKEPAYKGEPVDKRLPFQKAKINLRECKPVDIRPCEPVPPDTYSRIPPLNECNRPNLMNECPEPKCPYEEEDKKRRSGYRNILIAGILFTLATLAALYFLGGVNRPQEVKVQKKEEKKVKKKRVPTKRPSNSADIPNDVPYLLIGGGTASFSAFRAIKSADPVAKVLVISNEEHYPYMRPPLSKEIWFNEEVSAIKSLNFKQWNGSERSLFYEPQDFYTECKHLMDEPNGGVAVARGWTVARIDPCAKTVYLEDDYAIKYDKCLIATGARPKNLGVFEAAMSDPNVEDRVSLFRHIFDFEDVFEGFEQSKTVAVIGGGFLGSELACAMARRGKKDKKIIQVFREHGNMGKILPEYLSYWTTEKVKAEGVDVIPNAEVVGVKFDKDKLVLKLTTEEEIKVDHVVVAVGVEPNTQFAEHADLEVDPELGGYLVNTELMARSNLYVAGDCACFYDAKLGRRRIEHHDHAVVSGRLAGENMAGACNTYVHQSMFWSDLGPDVGYEAIGIVDSSLPTVGVFAKATDKDNPMAVVTATDEGIRSTTEEQVPAECKKYAAANKKDDDAAKEARKEMSQPQAGEDFGKGVIFYLRDDIVVGIVLWNVFNRMSIARQVLKDERKYDDLNEVAKLFNIHEE